MTYRHAHWYVLAALAAIVAGFWPSFFKPLGTGSLAHSVHGVTATLWVVAVMFANPNMPPFLPPLLAFIDLPSLAFMLLLVALALANVRTPAAHKRFMATTVLLAFPPALTRLYARVFEPTVDFMMALHGSFLTVEVVLVALILGDSRAGERRLAYPLSLTFFVCVHALMGPVAGSGWWGGLMGWHAGLGIFG